MKKVAVLLLASISSFCFASGDWVPEVNFKLESSNYRETLHWVSGVSYTLSMLRERNVNYICGAPLSIGSKELLGYLNGAHGGTTISSEQATATIFSKLEAHYPCK